MISQDAIGEYPEIPYSEQYVDGILPSEPTVEVIPPPEPILVEEYAKIPEFGQYVEYITQAKPVLSEGSIFYDVVINKVPSTIFDFSSLDTVKTVLGDVEKIQALPRKIDIAVESAYALEIVSEVKKSGITAKSLPVLDKVEKQAVADAASVAVAEEVIVK